MKLFKRKNREAVAENTLKNNPSNWDNMSNVSFKGNTNSLKAVVSYQQSIEAGTKAEKGAIVEVFFRSNETGDIGG